MRFQFDMIDIAIKLLAVGLVIISASFHEFGHAYAAHRCGDNTAKEAGRMTANPLAHIDPFGSVLLPVLCVMSGFGYLAYAKPVPYNPWRLRHPERDEVIVAIAGPAANIIQALVGALAYHACLRIMYGTPEWPYYLYYLEADVLSWLPLALQLYIQVNCSLAFFNLLPIPPLDGSKLLLPFFKGASRDLYYQIQRYALPLTMALIWFGPEILGIDPIGAWLDFTAGNLSDFLMGWA
jgi:Zn-dependent protease